MNLKEMLHPFPTQKTKVYGVVTENEKLDQKNYLLTVDLINEKMIKFDNEYIYNKNDVNLENNPKNYLYLYFMTIKVDYRMFEKYFSDQEYEKIYEYELIPEEEYDETSDFDAIKCTVYFTASPISEKGYYIKALQKVFTLPINIPNFKQAPLKSLVDINKELSSIFTYSMKVNYFRVHNVGQGSCNSILFHSKNKLFYDIGITKYSNKDEFYEKYVYTYSKFKYDGFDTVILSHWDEDHFLGICLDDNGDILRKNWIVPEMGISPNVKRIAYIIDSYGKLIRIANSVTDKFFEKDDVVLFKGSGSNKNDSGIILCLNNSHQNLVAMGDVAYECATFIPNYLNSSNQVFKSIDYLVVPHHGAKVLGNILFDPKVPITLSDNLKYPSDAIISVGYNPKTYNHPRNNTIVELHHKQFRIIRTDKDGRKLIKF